MSLALGNLPISARVAILGRLFFLGSGEMVRIYNERDLQLNDFWHGRT
jgi:hypothetical protein